MTQLALCACVMLESASCAGHARAQTQAHALAPDSDTTWWTSRGVSAEQIAQIAAGLTHADPSARRAAATALRGLHEESLPGIASRIAALRSKRPSSERVLEVMTALRHAVGSKRADDRVDRAQGVLSVLDSDHSQSARDVIEPLLLLRALEQMQTPAAHQHVADVLTLDEGGAWDHEARLLRERMGMRLLPALIALRSHSDSRVRTWAQQGVRALGMQDPAVATAIEDSHLLAQVVLAYSQPLDFEAMPRLARLVASDKLEVRSAARAVMARFGRNAIWQLRELYEEVAGQRADAAWDEGRTARELYAVLDRGAIEEADTLLAQGMAHLVAGRLGEMATLYDRLLALFPLYEERHKLAPGYAALAERHLQSDRLAQARDGYARALRLDPSAPDQAQWRAQLAFVDGEIALSRGVADLHAYERAQQLDPKHAAARAVLMQLSGEKAAQERHRKRLAAGAALVLLLATFLVALRGRRPARATAAPASRRAARN